LVLDANKDIGTIRNLTIDGVFTDGNYTFDTSGNVSGLGTVGCGAITSTGASSMGSLDVAGTLACDTSFTLDSVVVNATELGFIDGVTAGTAAASKAVVLDASKNIATLGTVGCGAITSTGASSMGSLDVSGAVSVAGTLSMAGDLVHTGDTNNKIAFGTDTQSFETGGTARINLSDSGLQIGTGTRVTTTLDEDDMASDSATALATQQSIKAYVDSADRVVTDVFCKNSGAGRHDAGGLASALTGSSQYWQLQLSQVPVEPTSRTAAVGQGVSVFINGVLQRFDTGSLNLDLGDGNDNWYGHFRRGTGSDANKKIIMIKHTLLDDDIISIKYSKA
jgi:hypothetical protein